MQVDERCRVYASISFAVILLAIGLPLWWETTAVPRAKVPHAEIGQLKKLELAFQLRLYLGCIEPRRSEQLAMELLERLTESGQSEILKMTVSHFATANTSIARMTSIAELERASGRFEVGHGEILVLEASRQALGGLEVHVSSGRSVYFSSDADGDKIAQVLREWIYRQDSLRLTRDALSRPAEFSLDVANRRRFPASPSYDVLLTVVNPEPEDSRVDRDVSLVAQNYIEPFLEELSLVADFSVKSQWLYLVPLGVRPRKVQNHYALSEGLLPQIITPLEKKLASQVSLHPTINLVAYMVPCSEAPLYIYDKNHVRATKDPQFEAFHSPRWGGIALVNPPANFCDTAKEDRVLRPNEQVVVGVFLQHLRLLLGVPDKESIEGAAIAPLRSLKPRDWELDDLLRIRAVEQLTSAKLTLQSLSKLLKEISNIVITEQVGRRISSALKLIHHATELLATGNLRDGFVASKQAFVTAEAAFSDPSLLALLYFPDDQKYAVYIPLFLPVMIPVLFSLKNIKNYLFCSD
ncbi:GPI transamidase component PIG-S isoform X2 [Phymastichus coffea]|uniref:GPI transamidase component PIG-S isoform X2 n=1 Tax=Phymastichus coffea TaxID=108790 RepID=UPI00273B0817|nr:GPI transamidase component PIG-S isoform X2 [Phymastichus coffea]